jgi:hypothetical protein
MEISALWGKAFSLIKDGTTSAHKVNRRVVPPDGEFNINLNDLLGWIDHLCISNWYPVV